MRNEYTILPEYSPLYPKLPYDYKDYHKISVYCRGHEEVIRSFLPSGLRIRVGCVRDLCVKK